MSVGEIPSAVVILMTLGINDEMGEASMAILSGCFGKYFGTADGTEFYFAGQLPSLGDSYSGTDTVVAAGTNPECDNFNFFSIEFYNSSVGP